MGHASDRPERLVAVAVTAAMTLLATGCGGDRGGSGGATAAAAGTQHHPGAQHNHGEAGAAVTADVNDVSRCDRGFNTARYNETVQLVRHVTDHGPVTDVEFTLEEWAEVFVDEDLGMSTREVLDALADDEIYRRHVLGGVLTHSLGPEPWIPMTDGEACEDLAAELEAARAVASRYPTVAEAVAAGYTQGDTYYAGLGVHYQNWDYVDAFEPSKPVQLLYDGTEPDANLVGLSYVVAVDGDQPPEGFTGDSDRWHRHRHYCLDLDAGGVNLSSDVLTDAECAAVGGTHVPNPNGWMLHAWVVPGCESDWGIFSGANPRLPYLPEGAALGPGCDSGRNPGDPLELDGRGEGPTIG